MGCGTLTKNKKIPKIKHSFTWWVLFVCLFGVSLPAAYASCFLFWSNIFFFALNLVTLGFLLLIILLQYSIIRRNEVIINTQTEVVDKLNILLSSNEQKIMELLNKEMEKQRQSTS